MSNFFSTRECAGGCGNLLTQKLVDSGRNYIYGHKGGCPKDGHPVQHRNHGKTHAPKPGPVEHVSYEKTLGLAVAGIKAVRIQREGLIRSLAEAQATAVGAEAAVRVADGQVAKLRKVIGALMELADKHCPEAVAAIDELMDAAYRPKDPESAA